MVRIKTINIIEKKNWDEPFLECPTDKLVSVGVAVVVVAAIVEPVVVVELVPVLVRNPFFGVNPSNLESVSLALT